LPMNQGVFVTRTTNGSGENTKLGCVVRFLTLDDPQKVTRDVHPLLRREKEHALYIIGGHT